MGNRNGSGRGRPAPRPASVLSSSSAERGERRSRVVCVIGAGTSGLAAIRGLTRAGHVVTAYEAGSQIGGMWRYDNDSGLSAAYASLCANTSRERMRYPSLPMRGPGGEFPHHREILDHLEHYARANELLEHITCGALVERVRQAGGRWEVSVRGHDPQCFDAVAVAAGHYWDPNVPELPGLFDGSIIHARDYRTPERFADRSVLVVGGGQSALDIAAELSGPARRTFLSANAVHHLLPRHIRGRPYDSRDTSRALALPLPLLRLIATAALRAGGDAPDRGELPPSRHPLFKTRPPIIVSPAVQAAIRERAFETRPAIRRLAGDHVIFSDGTAERVDAIVFATGYRITFPFLDPRVGRGKGWEFPLYRRILSPRAENLAFIGVLEPGPGLFEIVERQAEWLAEVLAGRVPIPDRGGMWRAINAGGERRSGRLFAASGAHTILCNRHAYLALLGRDLRRGRPKRSGDRVTERDLPRVTLANEGVV
jgi:dimethylaniline monooxygenase (N-oxide forming)